MRTKQTNGSTISREKFDPEIEQKAFIFRGQFEVRFFFFFFFFSHPVEWKKKRNICIHSLSPIPSYPRSKRSPESPSNRPAAESIGRWPCCARMSRSSSGTRWPTRFSGGSRCTAISRSLKHERERERECGAIIDNRSSMKIKICKIRYDKFVRSWKKHSDTARNICLDET